MDAGAGDDAGDGVWVTYGELAKARNIERRAAVRLAQRRRWRRQAGNDGLARVLVPHDWLKPTDRSRDIAGDVAAHQTGDDTHDDAGNVARAISVLQQAVDMLQDQLAAERVRGDDARDRAGRAETTAASLRDRLDDLTAKLADAQAELAAAMDAADRHHAAAADARGRLADMERDNDARKGRGRLARLRAAWRGE
jgi:hypothetical protein